MRTAISAAMLGGLMLVACARQTRVESGGEVMSPTPVDARTLPSGATITTRLDREIGTKMSRVGDRFSATVESDVIAQNNSVVVPAGAKVYGTVTGLQNSTNVGQTAAIKIAFEQLAFNGRTYPFSARVTATNLETRGGDTRNETLKKAGVGAAAGAVLGAVLSGGELSRILLGGAIGAAAGTAISLGTGDVEAVLPAGTRMTLETTQTVALRTR